MQEKYKNHASLLFRIGKFRGKIDDLFSFSFRKYI